MRVFSRKKHSGHPETGQADKHDEEFPKSVKWRNLGAFWLLGLCNNYGYVVMLSAAHDILQSDESSDTAQNLNATISSSSRKCNQMSTGVVLLADIIPSLIIKLTFPFVPFYLHARIIAAVASSFLGYIFVSGNFSFSWTITGVVLTSLSSGIGEITLLSYSHRFSQNVVSTWSSGTGAAGILGALSYAALKSFLSIRDTMLVMLIVPLTQAISFWLLVVHPKQKSLMTGNSEAGSQEEMIEEQKKSISEKIHLIPSLLKYMIPLILVYLFEYFINQGLYELIDFENANLPHKEQYRWLQVGYQVGVFISRSSVDLIKIPQIWVMSVFQFLNVLVFLSETLYFFIPSFWIVLGLVLWEGLLGGGSYVNTFDQIHKKVKEKDRETALGIVTMSDAIGIAIAAFAAIPVHNEICETPQPHRSSW